MKLEKRKTCRGFKLIEFKDRYDNGCSIQESSLADKEYCIWFGVDDPNPQIMASQASQFGVSTDKNCGWVPYPIPKEVSINTRMHLSQKQIKKLLPTLIKFAYTGEL